MKQNQSSSPRRQLNHERMLQEILQTARGIMREKGVAALSMQELARRMGMRAPSLYNYFSGLMDIYDALFRLGFQLWDEHSAATMQDAHAWQDEIRLIMEAYMTFAIQNPELYQLCFERPVPGFTPSQESLEYSLRSLQAGYARAAKISPHLHTDLPAEQIADLVIALMHGLTALHMANEPQYPLGQGRFGSLIPASVNLLQRCLGKGRFLIRYLKRYF